MKIEQGVTPLTEKKVKQKMISRRRMLALAGGVAAVLLSGCGRPEEVPIDSSGPCPLTPQQEEGPFYVDEGLVRSDLTAGQSGVPLELWVKVLTARTCEPVVGAAVEIWSANAAGKYSDMKREDTRGENFLRGIQLTDGEGFVKFGMIYPGWYSGRAPHLHLKVRTGGQASSETYVSADSRLIHTGQLFFPPGTNEDLRPVYPENKNEFVNNEKDRVFKKQGGQRTIVTLEGSLEAGFAATAVVDVSV